MSAREDYLKAVERVKQARLSESYAIYDEHDFLLELNDLWDKMTPKEQRAVARQSRKAQADGKIGF